MRLLATHGFYGLLLMNMRFRLTEEVETAATDGTFIYFSPTFLQELDDRELDFVLLHEVLHAALRHCARGEGKDDELFNIACDIVVNSTILQENNMDITSITLQKYGESMHYAPDGKEGFLYSAEQVYEMLKSPVGSFDSQQGRGGHGGRGKERGKKDLSRSRGSGSSTEGSYRDDHSMWAASHDRELDEIWLARVVQSARAVEIRDPSNERGLIPGFAKRILRELTAPQIDWRTILSEFIQPEVNDYSFSPPDRRFSDSPFFLPDYNEMGTGDDVSDILFMVDTSGSISDKMLAAALSEVRGAIEQFNGRLQGWLGYFDAAVIPPQPFYDEASFRKIMPEGGGGTNFNCIFEYVRTKMEKRPAFIVILTDGYARFPSEEAAMGIPVLWLLDNDIVEPPWGKVARMLS